MDRRTAIKTASAALAMAATPAAAQLGQRRRRFPRGFIWGAATAGHQAEGNDTASDTWFLANIQPTIFREPAGDAANSFTHWPMDLDLCVAMGLDAYRFSVEWSRIEPERGLISQAGLDHYRRMVDGCRARGLKPIVTYNHFTNPRWFAAAGGWLNGDAANLFAEQCARVTRAMGDGIDHAITFNEPNLPKLIGTFGLPPQLIAGERAMLARAAALSGTPLFVAGNVVLPEHHAPLEAAMLIGHARAKQAIKAERNTLPVGVSLAIIDDQAGPGGEARRNAMRAHLYEAWLQTARTDDFIGVQNYERAVWGPDGKLPPPPDARRGQLLAEVYPRSLEGAVRYAHSVARVPVLVSEHGVGTEDDSVRSWMIAEALRGLNDAMADGIPVRGYCHWSLIDNFEWIFGFGPKFGLHSVDRTSFRRTPKPSAAVYRRIVRANAV
jgi:beta-glucosidase